MNIDHNVKKFETSNKSMLPTKDYSDLKFLSKRNIMSEGKMYNSYMSVSLRKNTSSVLDDKLFWEDLPFFRIFREKSS